MIAWHGIFQMLDRVSFSSRRPLFTNETRLMKSAMSRALRSEENLPLTFLRCITLNITRFWVSLRISSKICSRSLFSLTPCVIGRYRILNCSMLTPAVIYKRDSSNEIGYE
ncbi:hypothetical protein T03_16927 [Trichinella britovi]|uniref:Uncharacterized protein n=1 Tax=Trichinella britovi TaxID=45882 RepID=A0A0V1AMY0_TRIBR|nr:hypothetical protein T03_16927 [Trichinella britovi]